MLKAQNNTNAPKNMGRNTPHRATSIATRLFNDITAKEKKELNISRRSVQDALANIRNCIDRHQTECMMELF